MLFEKPKVIFIKFSPEDVMTTSDDPGAGYSLCQRKGYAGMNQEAFCAEMMIAGMDLSGLPDV